MRFVWDFHEFEEFADKIGNLSGFDVAMIEATKRLAKTLLELMKSLTPVDSGTLVSGWDGNDFIVKKFDNGYRVDIVNTTPYAQDVNDGHMAYNQYGGAYPIHDEVFVGAFGKMQGRIAVPSPYQWQQGDKTMYVYGHFFVERAVLQLENTAEIEKIILKLLQNWWKRCFKA